jgi:predicted ribosomally synthesized peptide with SipW-like signal peptide
MSEHPRHQSASQTWRRVRSLMVAGLVLSIGTVATLAAWNDQEFATGTFAASAFEVESQTEASPYASQPDPPGSTLVFDVNGMGPGESTFAWMNMRTTAQTTIGGTIRLSSTSATGDLTQYLEYRAVRTADPMTTGACNADAMTDTGSTFIEGGPSQWEPLDNDPPAPAVFPVGPALDDIGVCFEVWILITVGDAAQGLTGTGAWGFIAISDG